jgi:hypothetical protein
MTIACVSKLRPGHRKALGLGIARRRTAMALFAAGVLLQASGAAAEAIRCAPERHWDDFASVVISVKGTFGDVRTPRGMTVETKVYDDGSLVVSGDDETRLEVIWWSRPEGRIALGNRASAPVELSESSMLYELALATLKQRFHGPCALRAKIRYPVKAGTSDDSVSGDIEREGDSVRFDLHEKRGRDLFTYSGRFAYKSSRGTIPADLAIAGWTVFRGSIDPQDGEPSSFATLGDLQKAWRSSEVNR